MKKRKNSKVIISSILICIILCMLIWLCIEIYTDVKIKKKETTAQFETQNLSTQNSTTQNLNLQKQNTQNSEKDQTTEEKQVNDTIQQTTKQYPKEQIIEEYRGYTVTAKLEIPKIQLETYILQNYSVEALNISVTKFWGANPNEIGNFCVAGHNFQNKNMFRNLKNLEKGDRLFISDNKIGRLEYEIYDIYKVQPEDVSCLNQETGGNREVTLITCTKDSKHRIIVKARE